MAQESDAPNDPLNLDAIDREIRINDLEEQAKELGMRSSFVSKDCPPEVHEMFLRNMLEFESGPCSTRFAELESAGVALPPPDTLDDAALHAKLWEAIDSLAALSVFLSRTNHLSERQLYEHLWTDSLREPITMMPPDSGWINYIDILGSCSEEDIKLDLRYYMDERNRQRWAQDFPSDVIPPHEDPPFDRDRMLPRPDDKFVQDEPEEDV